jgi:hypothetical protein
MGGVYNTINAHLYHYAGNNPVKYTDPDGKASNQPLVLKQVETVVNIARFYNENKDAIQKIGIGAAKVAMGLGIGALGVGGGAGITIGSGGAAALGGVALADAAIVAGGVYVGEGAADVLDGIVMMSQGDNNGSGNIKHLSEQEITKRTGSSVHEVKDTIKQQFGKEIKDNNIGGNFELYEKNGDLIIKGNKTGKEFSLNLPLESFGSN